MKNLIGNLYGIKGGLAPARIAELRKQVIPVCTTTEKRALSVEEGTVVYDTTLNKLCVYTKASGGSSTGWETITSGLE